MARKVKCPFCDLVLETLIISADNKDGKIPDHMPTGARGGLYCTGSGGGTWLLPEEDSNPFLGHWVIVTTTGELGQVVDPKEWKWKGDIPDSYVLVAIPAGPSVALTNVIPKDKCLLLATTPFPTKKEK